MSGAKGTEADLSQDAGAQLTVVGALRLVRFLPVLEVSGLPVIEEVRAVVMSRGRELEVALAVGRCAGWPPGLYSPGLI